MSKLEVLSKLEELSKSDSWGIDCNNHYILSIQHPDSTISKSYRIVVSDDAVIFKREDQVLFFTKDVTFVDNIRKNAENCMIELSHSFLEVL